METSMSALRTFQRCERKYLYEYVRGWKPVQTQVKESWRLGTLFHFGLQNGYDMWMQEETIVPPKGFTHYAKDNLEEKAAELALTPEVVELCSDMIDFYWENVGQYDRFQVLEVEKHGVLDLDGNKMRCTLDVVAQEPDGTILGIDHKTVYNVKDSLFFLPIDFQMLSYDLFLKQEYPDQPRKMIYNMVRREVPPGFGHRSLLTASGRRSTASTDPGDYVRREITWRTETEQAAFDVELYDTLLRLNLMNFERAPRRVIRSGGDSCQNCLYKTPCRLEFSGRQLNMNLIADTYRIEPQEQESNTYVIDD